MLGLDRMDNIKTALQKYGLNRKQISLYLAALVLGTSSITQLSKKSGLKRSTTYVIIEEIIKRHLLIPVPQGKTMYYKAESPEKLLGFLEDSKDAIKQILPELQDVYLKKVQQPKVRFYEGRDKILQVYDEIFRAKEIWAMFSYDAYLQVFSEKESKHFFNILNRQGGILYNLLPNTKKARELVGDGYRKGSSETKILPREFKFATDILVFDNKVALISFDNLTATIITDHSIAHSQKLTLQFIWNSL